MPHCILLSNLTDCCVCQFIVCVVSLYSLSESVQRTYINLYLWDKRENCGAKVWSHYSLVSLLMYVFVHFWVLHCACARERLNQGNIWVVFLHWNMWVVVTKGVYNFVKNSPHYVTWLPLRCPQFENKIKTNTLHNYVQWFFNYDYRNFVILLIRTVCLRYFQIKTTSHRHFCNSLLRQFSTTPLLLSNLYFIICV